MVVIRGRQRYAEALGGADGAPPSVLAIGNFDGVHRGHQALLAEVRRLAQSVGARAGVLTFDPHPARFFAPKLAPPMILTLDRRIELLGAAGAEFVVIEPFDATLAALPPETFVADVLARDLNARDVVVGHDFTFGRGRAGNPAVLAKLGEQLGVGVTVVPAVCAPGEGLVCSSTKVREFVLEGRVEGATLLLGRPFEVTGPVVRGAGRGRPLGFPTANLRPEAELVPRTGIYAAHARRLDQPSFGRPAAVSIGTNPTFATGSTVTVEAYLLDFDGDLYDQRLRLEFVARLRDEQRFAAVSDLVAQIEHDVAHTRKLCA